MAYRFRRCPACGFGLAASFRASLSVVNRLIRPAGLSPAWLPASPAHAAIDQLARMKNTGVLLDFQTHVVGMVINEIDDAEALHFRTPDAQIFDPIIGRMAFMLVP